jgi:hypothetical protein
MSPVPGSRPAAASELGRRPPPRGNRPVLGSGESPRIVQNDGFDLLVQVIRQLGNTVV